MKVKGSAKSMLIGRNSVLTIIRYGDLQKVVSPVINLV